MKGHAIIGFNHGVLGLAENLALGLGFFLQNTSDYALGVLTPKASPSGWVFSQAQHPMIKTYNNARLFSDDVTTIRVSYWWRKEFSSYARLHRGKILYNAWLATSRFGTSLANFSFVVYRNQIIHIIIGFKHDVSCIVRSEALRPLGYATLILEAPLCLRSHNARYSIQGGQSRLTFCRVLHYNHSSMMLYFSLRNRFCKPLLHIRNIIINKHELSTNINFQHDIRFFEQLFCDMRTMHDTNHSDFRNIFLRKYNMHFCSLVCNMSNMGKCIRIVGTRQLLSIGLGIFEHLR